MTTSEPVKAVPTLEARIAELESTTAKLVVAVENLYNHFMDKPVDIADPEWPALWETFKRS